jgi:N-acetylglucosaminyl-diphospho-decaprenol L-rhamnosyltransferase
MRVGLATIQQGRHRHLNLQALAVKRVRGLSRYVVVSMDDAPAPPGAEILRMPIRDRDRLPLAAARNRAVAHLDDCDLVVLLDVDCLPHPRLIETFLDASRALAVDRAVMFGPVGWLAEPVSSAELAATLAAAVGMPVKRDFPASGVARETRPELFWSLAFAVAPAAHRRVGGFDEGYAGWGAEDTDYGRRAHAMDVGLWKVAEAWAFHQPHPPAYRTAGQIDAVVENARRFHGRWGDWPMPDVLAQLAAAGAISWTPDGGSITGPSEIGGSVRG